MYKQWLSDLLLAVFFAVFAGMLLGCAVLGLCFLVIPEWAPRIGHLTALFAIPTLFVVAFTSFRKSHKRGGR